MEHACAWVVQQEQLSAVQYAENSSVRVPLGVPQQALRTCHPLSHLVLLKQLSSMKAISVLTAKTLHRTPHFTVL